MSRIEYGHPGNFLLTWCQRVLRTMTTMRRGRPYWTRSRLRETNQKKRRAFCEQLLPRLKLVKARVLAKSRPGIDVQSIVFHRREDLPRAGWQAAAGQRDDEGALGRNEYRVLSTLRRVCVHGAATLQHPKAHLRSGSKRARTEQSQRTPGVMVSAGLCGKATPQLLVPFLIEDSCKIDSGCLMSDFGGLLRASLVAHPGKRTTHQATAVRPRRTGRRRTFRAPSLVGLHSLQAWPRWTPGCLSASRRAFFVEGCSQKQPLPVHLLWSRRPMLLARRSVRSKIAFSSVSIPRHDFLQVLHSWCESKKL